MIEKTYDLSTLNLSAGTHEITVKARAIGYGDSWPSNEVSYSVVEETVQISGSWKFKGGFYPTLDIPGFVYNVNFVSNGVSFSSIEVARTGATLHYDDVEVARMGSDSNIWANENYRTITFDGTREGSKGFYWWLVTNAVKQEIAFTIDDTTYYAKEGMTWSEWVDSEYNTIGAIIEYWDGNKRQGYFVKVGNKWVVQAGSALPADEEIGETAYYISATTTPDNEIHGGGSN